MTYLKSGRPTDCSGCRACEQICPKQCICMEADDEGFLYPKVNPESCIHCHLCERPARRNLTGFIPTMA